jgi:hypothetical protein
MKLEITPELKTYIDAYDNALQEYKDVSKGGKDYSRCSFMDICVRSDSLEQAKNELVVQFGLEAFRLYKDELADS